MGAAQARHAGCEQGVGGRRMVKDGGWERQVLGANQMLMRRVMVEMRQVMLEMPWKHVERLCMLLRQRILRVDH